MKFGQNKTDCFVCENTPQILTEEKPYQWLKPRFACLGHRASAVLESGELVEAFLARGKSKEYPLEGSGLNCLINPVSINGIKAWNDFVGGGRAVLEEVFPSHNYFEYFVQHMREPLNVFYALYKDKKSLSDEISLNQLSVHLDTELKQECFFHLVTLRSSVMNIQKTLTAQGKTRVESPDEIGELFLKQEPNRYEFMQFVEMVSFLLELGERRFAHLSDEI